MTLFIDVAAIAHNAVVVRDRARHSGLNVTAVVKGPFGIPSIIDAVLSSGINTLGLSSAASADAVRGRNRPCYEFIGLPLPEQAAAIVQHMDASLHICRETINAFALAAEEAQVDHGIWIGILSSDDREGVATEELLGRIVDWNDQLGKRLVLEGILAHWGCHFEVSPEAQEIEAVLHAAIELGERLQRAPLNVSLGGSTLLPMLGRFMAPPRTQLRIGEAILTGTIPGCEKHGLGLREPFSIDARIVEVSARRVEGALRPRVLIDYGASVLDYRDIRLIGSSGRAQWSSSGMTAVELFDSSQAPRIGETLTFTIGYRSALRALSNPEVSRCERNLTGGIPLLKYQQSAEQPVLKAG